MTYTKNLPQKVSLFSSVPFVVNRVICRVSLKKRIFVDQTRCFQLWIVETPTSPGPSSPSLLYVFIFIFCVVIFCKCVPYYTDINDFGLYCLRFAYIRLYLCRCRSGAVCCELVGWVKCPTGIIKPGFSETSLRVVILMWCATRTLGNEFRSVIGISFSRRLYSATWYGDNWFDVWKIGD